MAVGFGFAPIVPILAFLLVTVVGAAVLINTKVVSDRKGWNVFIALLLASVFISAVSARVYVSSVLPWFVVMLFSLVLVLILINFVGKPGKKVEKGLGVTVLVMAGIIFLGAAFFVFSEAFARFIPTSPVYGLGFDGEQIEVLNWIYSPPIFGTLLLIGISAIVIWVLFRKK